MFTAGKLKNQTKKDLVKIAHKFKIHANEETKDKIIYEILQVQSKAVAAVEKIYRQLMLRNPKHRIICDFSTGKLKKYGFVYGKYLEHKSLNSAKVSELKELLVFFGAPTCGIKKDLIERVNEIFDLETDLTKEILENSIGDYDLYSKYFGSVIDVNYKEKMEKWQKKLEFHRAECEKYEKRLSEMSETMDDWD